MISETGVWNPLKGLTEFGWHFEQNVYFSGGLIRALKAGGGSGNIPKIIIYNGSDMEGINVLLTPEEREYIIRHSRVRKLTPRDCMRLMGVSDGDFDKMKADGISDTQLYRMAGNSIVIPVLEGIFTQMFRMDSDCLF